MTHPRRRWRLLTEWTASDSLRNTPWRSKSPCAYGRTAGANEDESGVVALLHDSTTSGIPRSATTQDKGCEHLRPLAIRSG